MTTWPENVIQNTCSFIFFCQKSTIFNINGVMTDLQTATASSHNKF